MPKTLRNDQHVELGSAIAGGRKKWAQIVRTKFDIEVSRIPVQAKIPSDHKHLRSSDRQHWASLSRASAGRPAPAAWPVA